LIAVPVGLIGIVLYLSVKWYFETAKKVKWADGIVAVVIEGVAGACRSCRLRPETDLSSYLAALDINWRARRDKLNFAI
jgi:hypothetical protein